MPSITSWTRLEPKINRDDFNISLQARIKDPLWLLGKQWQLGEFNGEDAGSPIVVKLSAENSRLSRYHMGTLPGDKVTGQKYDMAIPLEILVEREAITRDSHSDANWRLVADTGLQLLRILDANGIQRYRTQFISQFPIEIPAADTEMHMDSDSSRFLALMSHRAPHGVNLFNLLEEQGPESVLQSLEIQPQDKIALQAALAEWSAWYRTLFSETEGEPQAWISNRLEYEFSVATKSKDSEYVLTAPEYTQGDLDWYAFDINPGASLDAKKDTAGETMERQVIPSPVTYQGMPARRWWEFEDARVDFGEIETGPEDLGRLVFLEFAVNYSNDWFVIPVDLPIGSVCEINSLVVIDTFGVQTKIRPYTDVDGLDTDWQLFCAAVDMRNRDATTDANIPPPKRIQRLFLPPVLGTSLHSQPVEEVLFLRDEMANMAWGVEKIIEGGVGQAINRLQAYLEKYRLIGEGEAQRIATGADQVALYKLATRVPDYWVPLLPVQQEDGRSIRLQRGLLLDPDTGDLAHDAARGRILQPDKPLVLFEEEVPRAGKRVTREWRYTRWHDGTSYVWVGRRVRPGQGEGSSGLRFDALIE